MTTPNPDHQESDASAFASLSQADVQAKLAELKAAGYPVLDHQEVRLRALYDLQILDTEFEPRFDAITRIASTVCGTSIAAISLIDYNRQWFKSTVGLEIRETDRESSFCQYTILQDDFLIVTDTHLDDRLANTPLVKGPPNLRFYAGITLHDMKLNRLGSLCVMDSKPMNLNEEQKSVLRTLSSEVKMLLEVRKRDLQIMALERQLEQQQAS